VTLGGVDKWNTLRGWNELGVKCAQGRRLVPYGSELSEANARVSRFWRLRLRVCARLSHCRSGAYLQALKTEWEQDFLVFPIAFLYRHHIELTLKRLIILGALLADQRLTEVEKKHLKRHRLDFLWSILKGLLVAVYDLPKEDIEGIESYVSQLNQVDPESQSFGIQYPQRKFRGYLAFGI